MNHRIAQGSRRLAGSSAVFTVLLAFCLNLAALPCAMALGLDDRDCPHAPPAGDHPVAGHQGHDNAHAGHETAHAGHDTGHLHEMAGPDCLTSASSCCDAAASSIDTRTSPHKIKNQGADLPLAGPVSQYSLPTTADVPYALVDPPDPPGAAVPRHVLFCVYLD